MRNNGVMNKPNSRPQSRLSSFLVATLLLGGLCAPLGATMARTAPVSSAHSESQPAGLQAEPEQEAMSLPPTEATAGIAKKPPTHMQRCQASCRGVKGASAHSRCIHNCMSR